MHLALQLAACTDQVAIFEAKGSSSRQSQTSQIERGLDKKRAHHKRRQRFDLELIVSTCIARVGYRKDSSRIVLADPEFDDDDSAFGEGFDDFYRLRHYARAAMFSGAPITARRFALLAELAVPALADQYRTEVALTLLDGAADREVNSLETFVLGDATYLGRWLSSTDRVEVDMDSRERSRMRVVRERLGPNDLFQGIDATLLSSLGKGPGISLRPAVSGEEGPHSFSAFDDGTLLVAGPPPSHDLPQLPAGPLPDALTPSRNTEIAIRKVRPNGV
jgi:hypothetical protein